MTLDDAKIEMSKGRAVYSESLGLTMFMCRGNTKIAVVPRIGTKGDIVGIKIADELRLSMSVDDWVLSGVYSAR